MLLTALAVRGRRNRRRTRTLVGRTAIVTGGARGLGLLVAEELGARGAHLVICARDTAQLERARHRLEEHGYSVLALSADVTRRADLAQVIDSARARFGSVDVLVNNAGVMTVGAEASLEREEFEQAMAVHFWAPFELTRLVLPEMRARGSGVIVNISSVGGAVSVPHMLPYSASKFALAGFSEGLHAELARDGITVTTVIPGLMRTGSARNAFFAGDREREYAWFSVAAASPLFSMDPRRAARRIVDGALGGRPYLVLTLSARLALVLHGILPSLTDRAFRWINRALPAPHPMADRAIPGRRLSRPGWLRWLSFFGDRAAARYNQLHSPMDGSAAGRQT
jgi:NAD(P)-dependent dehydrogenase (short-subunit alcohol dehydrogenase family)